MEPIKTIGKKLKGGEQRDCIHIAILPCICDEQLCAGDPAELVVGTTDHIIRCKGVEYRTSSSKVIGVVDPFLKGYTEIGDRVWVFMQPGSITGMRHHWFHPDIPEPLDEDQYVATKVYQKMMGPAYESENWLKAFAQRHSLDYEEMIRIAQDGNGYITAYGSDLHGGDELGEEYNEFWDHMEIFTKRKFDEPHREGVGWSCTC